MYLVTAEEMQEMDRRTIEEFGIPGRVLMENAGRGATQVLCSKFPGLSRKRVAVVAGRGNNGGDGFVIARCLAQQGTRVTVYLLAESARITGDARANLKLLPALDVPVIEMPDRSAFVKHKTALLQEEIWVDAVLGTGLKSDVKGYFKEVIEFINHTCKPVFSVDIASGLNSDSGQRCGVCIKAHVTATFAFAKIGHLVFPGADYTGDLEIIDIGIPPHIAGQVGPMQQLLTPQAIRSCFKPRTADAHKGKTGHLAILAGSPGKTGAAAMTAVAALRAGAGLVTLGVPASLNPVLETVLLEAMTLPLPESGGGLLGESSFDNIAKLLTDKKCLAIGPGLGTAAETRQLVCRVIRECHLPMVIDADGLNDIAGHTHILEHHPSPLILTPHPGEMARLMDTTPAAVQTDRIGHAREFSGRYRVHVVLKGARTVIAHPDGSVFINPTGNPGMAAGGMGDVLTGIIAGLMTQGFTPQCACHAGVYLHGSAADTLAEKRGPFGYLASEVMRIIPDHIGRLLATYPDQKPDAG